MTIPPKQFTMKLFSFVLVAISLVSSIAAQE